jgi:hypothetical protein
LHLLTHSITHFCPAFAIFTRAQFNQSINQSINHANNQAKSNCPQTQAKIAYTPALTKPQSRNEFAGDRDRTRNASLAAVVDDMIFALCGVFSLQIRQNPPESVRIWIKLISQLWYYYH